MEDLTKEMTYLDERTKEVISRITNIRDDEYYIFPYYKNDEGDRVVSTVPVLLLKTWESFDHDIYRWIYQALCEFFNDNSLKIVDQNKEKLIEIVQNMAKSKCYSLKVYKRHDVRFMLCLEPMGKNHQSLIILAVVSGPIADIKTLNTAPMYEMNGAPMK